MPRRVLIQFVVAMIFGGLFLGMLGAMHFGWKGFIVWGLCGVSAGIFGVWAGTPIVREPEPKKVEARDRSDELQAMERYYESKKRDL